MCPQIGQLVDMHVGLSNAEIKGAYRDKRWHDIQAPMAPRSWRQETDDLHRHRDPRRRNFFSPIPAGPDTEFRTGELSEAGFVTHFVLRNALGTEEQ